MKGNGWWSVLCSFRRGREKRNGEKPLCCVIQLIRPRPRLTEQVVDRLPALIRVLNALHAGVDRVIDRVADRGGPVDQRRK